MCACMCTHALPHVWGMVGRKMLCMGTESLCGRNKYKKGIGQLRLDESHGHVPTEHQFPLAGKCRSGNNAGSSYTSTFQIRVQETLVSCKPETVSLALRLGGVGPPAAQCLCH